MESKKYLILNSFITMLAPMIWGTTYWVTTVMLPPESPLTTSVLRALPAGILLLLLVRQFPRGIWWGRIFLLGALNIGIFFYCLFVAAYRLPGGIAAILMAIQPIIVLALSYIMFKQPIRFMQILAGVIGIISIFLLVWHPVTSLDPIGILAGIAGAVSMACGIVLTKHWGMPPGVNLLGSTGWQLVFGGVILLPIALFSEGIPHVLSGMNIAGFLYLSLIGGLLAYVIWFRGIQRLPAVSISFIAFGSPLTATLLGIILLDESFSLAQIIGILGVTIAIVLAQKTSVSASKKLV
ncbi:EamA family transporter [Aliikangiella maris]|uniref:EamA family transporter n=2 Tax=Aliikangiella maris TaxID=3162458 RepID=A0ABV3MRY1_9GAMM